MAAEITNERELLIEAMRVLNRKITYVLTGGQFGIEPGYVVLGLKKA